MNVQRHMLYRPMHTPPLHPHLSHPLASKHPLKQLTQQSGAVTPWSCTDERRLPVASGIPVGVVDQYLEDLSPSRPITKHTSIFSDVQPPTFFEKLALAWGTAIKQSLADSPMAEVYSSLLMCKSLQRKSHNARFCLYYVSMGKTKSGRNFAVL